MAQKITFRDKLRYGFENTLAAGPIAIIGWLAILSLLIVFIAGLIIVIARITTDPESGESWSFVDAVWNSLMRTLDAGNMADDSGWGFRIISLLVTIGGIFIVSTLIGTITSGMEGSIDEMRKGRSRVLESNHTLILGWSPKIFTIISELLIANENQKKPRIVILADKDKVEMEDAIKSKFSDTKNTRIICRSGSPLDLDDLEVASPHQARSIIIVSPDEVSSPDTFVIKSILAITNNPNRRTTPYHIVAELRDERNLEAAELVGNNETVLVLSSDLIARVAAQTCRQSGLSVVYTELLDFDGAEIYLKEEPGLVGQTYLQALHAYESSALIGIFRKDNTLLLNPPMNTLIENGDQVIAISEDDDTIVLSKQVKAAPDRDAIRLREPKLGGKERTLVLGWNEKGASIIRELDNYVVNGSEVVVASNDEESEGIAAELAPLLKRQQLSYIKGDTTQRAVLNSLQVATFDHIILLCYNHLDVQEADAQVLITLLHLRNIAEQSGRDFSIVSEMRDIRNRALADVARADDFIVSDKLVSLLLSQLSENKRLELIFKDLFSAEGSEIYLKPISDYVVTGRNMNFHTLLEAAADKGETAIGYRITALAGNAHQAYGVVVNPTKSQQVVFNDEDMIIVLAED